MKILKAHEKSAYHLGRAARSMTDPVKKPTSKVSPQAMFRSWTEAECWRTEQQGASMCYYWMTVQRHGWYVVERRKK